MHEALQQFLGSSVRSPWFKVLGLIVVVASLSSTWNHAIGQARPEIRSPAAFHGFDLGTQYVITQNVFEYYRELGQRSPRVEYREYGRSIQGRPLPMLIIGSEQNLGRLDEIQQRMSRLTEVTAALSETELQEVLTGMPSIVWIYIVDVDEEAGVNVLQELAYDLATK